MQASPANRNRSESSQRLTSAAESAKGPPAGGLRPNPAILPDLPDLDGIGCVVIEVHPVWVRCFEGLVVHLAGSGVAAAQPSSPDEFSSNNEQHE